MWVFYFVALIEWFSTLAVEIIALRIAAPVTGSSSVVTSVFLGVILLALSAGYRVWWRIASQKKHSQIINILIRYLMFASLYYMVISFGLETWMLTSLLEVTASYLLTLFITAGALFFIPVFIASQTIPLLTELLDDVSKGKAAGKMLFASTIGSFLGSVLTSIVLFQTLGVTLTAIIISCLLFASVSCLIWEKSHFRAYLIICIAICFGAILWLWRSLKYERLLYNFDSAYQQIQIAETWIGDYVIRMFLTNKAYASSIFAQTLESPFQYIREAIGLALDIQPEHVLVIGTAWFTFPYEVAIKIASVQNIDAVDVDPQVKMIAEKYFLQTKLPENIVFYPQSARYFVNQARKQWLFYDLIFIDAFNGKTLPDELTTQEFFTDIQQLTSNEGVVVINFILDRSLESDLAQNVLTTVSTVFGGIWIKQTTKNDEYNIENFIITTKKLANDYIPFQWNGVVYTDDKRSTELDTMKMYR